MPSKEVSRKTASMKESIANDKPRRQEDLTKLAQKIERLGRDQAIQNLQALFMGMEPKRKIHPDKRERRSLVKKLYKEGLLQREIALSAHTSRSTVNRDLKQLRETGEIKY